MEELLNKREELKTRVNDLKMEISMGKILEDEEMISSAEKEIETTTKLIEETNQKIELEQKKNRKKKELSQKYPEQYKYHRIMTMSEEELRRSAEKELEEKRKHKAELETKKENLSKIIETTEERLSEIKKEFKETHANNLLEEAAKLMKQYQSLKKEMKYNLTQIEAIGPLEISPEEYRQIILSKLKGEYKVSNSEIATNYIQSQQESGKSIDEIVKDLNAKLSGQFTVEDVEDYLIEQEFIKEVEEIANKDSQIEKERILNNSEETELDKALENIGKVLETQYKNNSKKEESDNEVEDNTNEIEAYDNYQDTELNRMFEIPPYEEELTTDKTY